jgi:hypothetical protein
MRLMCGIETWRGLSALMILVARRPGALPQAGMGTRLWRSLHRAIEIPLPPLDEQRRLVAELDAETAQMDSVRALLPRFAAKIQRVLDRVWGNTPEATL